jgi:hypothetical protein
MNISIIKENDGRSEKSWRYVHHEMNEQERREFERMMRDDEALRRETKRIRQINGSLRELMPLTEQTEETLVDGILREWERSTVDSPSRIREKFWAPFMEGIRDMIEEWRWPSYAWPSLATVAATVLLVVGIQAYLAGPLEWMRPEISMGVQYRGGEPEKAPSYSRGDILELHGALRRSVEKYYAGMKGGEHPTSWLGRGRKWRLAAKYQELPDGGTQVQVTLYSSRHGTQVKEWSNYYPVLRSFGNEVDKFGEQMVKDLLANETETK